MKRACLYVNPFFVENRIFSTELPLNRDNQLEPYRLLKQEFARRGYELATQDINPPDAASLVIYIDSPKHLPSPADRDKSYLLILESELIRPDNWKIRSHRRFKTVFTWSERLLRDFRGRQPNYVKINFPMPPIPTVPGVPFSERNLCCLVSGGKLSLHPLELYSERIKWIRWFERNHPEQFAFFGAGWKKLWMTGPLYIRAINKLPFWRRFIGAFPSYRGPTDDKLKTIADFKFAICFENARDIEGYITEKIFDCFYAGTIPIYRGANDITEKVPKNTFIDLRDFKGFDDVYDYISSIDERTFREFQSNMKAYLASDLYGAFTAERFVQTIVENTIQ